MTRKDWTLLVIAEAGTRPLEPVQLQKSLFLLSKNLNSRELKIKPFYKFSPYDFGPFCGAIYTDVEQLETDGLVRVRKPPETRFNKYLTTGEGEQKARALKGGLAPHVADYLTEVVKYTQSLSFSALVSAIYKEYPKMRVNSIFQD